MKQDFRTNPQDVSIEWPSKDVPLGEVSRDLVRCVTFYLNDTGAQALLRKISEDNGQYSLAPSLDLVVQELLDQGQGECSLKNPIIAQIIEQVLLEQDGEQYCLYAWMVHHNHVHALIELSGVYLNHHVVDNWKSSILRQLTQYGISFIPLWSPGFLVSEVSKERDLDAWSHYIESEHMPCEHMRTSFRYKK